MSSKKGEDLKDVTTDRLPARNPEDTFRSRIEEDHVGLIVERNQPGGDTSNNSFVECFELNNIALLGLQLDPAFAGLLRRVTAQEGHQVKGGNIDHRDEEDVSALMLDGVA